LHINEDTILTDGSMIIFTINTLNSSVSKGSFIDFFYAHMMHGKKLSNFIPNMSKIIGFTHGREGSPFIISSYYIGMELKKELIGQGYDISVISIGYGNLYSQIMQKGDEVRFSITSYDESIVSGTFKKTFYFDTPEYYKK